MSEARRQFTARITTILSADPTVRARRAPDGEAAMTEARRALLSTAAEEGYALEAHTVQLTGYRHEDGHRDCEYTAWAVRPHTSGNASLVAAPVLRFTPLSPAGSPLLGRSFVVDDRAMDLRVRLDPLPGGHFRVQLLAVVLNGQAAAHANDVIRELHAKLQDVRNFALEAWAETGDLDRWGYLAVPWLTTPVHGLRMSRHRDELLHRTLMHLDFTEATSRSEPPPWPEDAPLVVVFDGRTLPMPTEERCDFVYAVTPIAPPSS